MTNLRLYASSLLGKWGFDDGDIIGDHLIDIGGERYSMLLEHEILEYLVREHLLSIIETAGHAVELEIIQTIHNPVRARTLNGEEVDHYNGDIGALGDIYVDVTPQQFEDACAALRGQQ